jgi:acyl carrier protein
MNEPRSTQEQIREFVMRMAENKGVRSFSDKESLTDAGIVDSLAVFRLISFLEQTFSMGIADEDIVIENFDSIDNINRFLMSKLGLPRHMA